jgi:hypothetical protein
MENKWYSIIYNSLLIVGIIITLVTVGSYSKGNLTGTIIGYSFIVTGILLMIGYLLNNINNSSASTSLSISNFSFISSLITVGPFVLLIGIILYMIYLLSYYFNQISSGRVPGGYYTFMNIFIILLIVEFYVFYNGMQDKNFKTTGTIGKVTGMILYLLELISVVTVVTLGIILHYFSTDG